jgi:hypothetical protein
LEIYQLLSENRVISREKRGLTLMTPHEAKKIIEALSQGIDPESGEFISSRDTLQTPIVTQALLLASKALDSAEKRTKRLITLPSNAGQPWCKEKDQELSALFASGMSLRGISSKLARTDGAISARLFRLGHF